jgi:AcrR family transcriptional regulator
MPTAESTGLRIVAQPCAAPRVSPPSLTSPVDNPIAVDYLLLIEYTLNVKGGTRGNIMPRTEEANRRIRAERSAQILDTAAEIFAHKGLAGARTADIAAACKMSEGLLFHYFASKEDIFAAVVEAALQAAGNPAQSVLEQPGTPLEKLRRLLQIYLPGMWSKPAYFLVILQALNSEITPQALREHVLEQSARNLRIYRQLIAEGQLSGEVAQGDPALLAMVFGACIQGLGSGVLHWPLLLGPSGPPDLEMVLRLLKP